MRLSLLVFRGLVRGDARIGMPNLQAEVQAAKLQAVGFAPSARWRCQGVMSIFERAYESHPDTGRW